EAAQGSEHVLMGDNAQLGWTDDGVLVSAESLATNIGGNDDVFVNAGNVTWTGGVGDDSLTISDADQDSQHVLMGDNAQLGWTDDGVLVSAESLATDIGGNDDVFVNAGNVTWIGGVGDDSLTISDADQDSQHVLMGDNAQLGWTDDGVLVSAESLATDIGGNDDVFVNAGNVTWIGGVGNDTLEITDADQDSQHVLMGDNGRINWLDTGLLNLIESVTPEAGGNDTISVNAGTVLAIGGSGKNEISTGLGSDRIIGDNGRITFDGQGEVKKLTSTHFEFGDGDIITSDGGDNWVIGGKSSNTIDLESGDGDNSVIGNNGLIEGENSIRRLLQSLDVVAATAGNNNIATGSGRDYVIAGIGSNITSNKAGESIVIGDDGVIEADDEGRYIRVASGDPSLGANNDLNGGADRDILIGGAGDDIIRGGDGNDILFGDFGRVIRTEDRLFVDAKHLYEGGNDKIYADGGNNIAIGGAGQDLFDANFATDAFVGDYGFFEIEISAPNERERILHFETVSYGRVDLIRATLEELYTTNRHDDLVEAEPIIIARPLGSMNVIDTAATMGSEARGLSSSIADLIDTWMERQSGSLRSSIASATALAATESLRNAPEAEIAEVTAGQLAGGDSTEEPLEIDNPAPDDEIIEETEDDGTLTEAMEATDEELSTDEELPESDVVTSEELDGLPAGWLATVSSASALAVAHQRNKTNAIDRLEKLRRESAARNWKKMTNPQKNQGGE
ncbi:hypothetical protein MOY_03508, partial [Halomonas sp. GFAJ-1]